MCVQESSCCAAWQRLGEFWACFQECPGQDVCTSTERLDPPTFESAFEEREPPRGASRGFVTVVTRDTYFMSIQFTVVRASPHPFRASLRLIFYPHDVCIAHPRVQHHQY